MQIPLLPASLRPPITSRPVGTPFLGREKGRTVNRAGPGRDEWEGAGGSVGQDPGRVLLRFSHRWGENRGEKETAQGCIWQEGAQEQERCRTLWEVPGGTRARRSTSQMQRSADHFSETQIFWTHTFHVASLAESRAGGGVSRDTCTGALWMQKVGAAKMGSEVRDSWERRSEGRR